MAETPPRIISEIHAARQQMLAGTAREALERLASFETPFATLALVRGECHYVLGEWREAAQEFKTALQLSPNSPRAEIMLGLASEMIELSRTMRPAVSIEQLIGAREDLTFVSDLPSISTLRLSEEMKDMEHEEIPEGNEIGLVSETLAELMVRQGKFDDARKVYIQLSRLNPDRYEYFREQIEKLEDRN